MQVGSQVFEQRGQVLPGGGALPNVAPSAEGGARAGGEYSPDLGVLVAARELLRAVTKSIVFLGGRSKVMRKPLLSMPDDFFSVPRAGSSRLRSINYR